MKKVIYSLIIVIFFTPFFCVDAYEYVNSKNSSSVEGLITEIYGTKKQYEELAGEPVPITYTKASNSNLFWWPIGSKKTTTNNGNLFATGNPIPTTIGSVFGASEPFRNGEIHKGIDISTSEPDPVYIIASKGGEVIYPVSKSQTQYSNNGYLRNPDGGGRGNYVTIRHADGKFTLYYHLAPNTITVFAGDTVEQGQVIGQMGSSGSSTGKHLHFSVQDANGVPVDPQDYVDIKNPRPQGAVGSSFSAKTTSLSKEEFVAKMKDYAKRSKNQNIKEVFLPKAESIYTTSVNAGINPELVVVTAKVEQQWHLSAECRYTNNYWGIGITNSNDCHHGEKYASLEDGIRGYANLLKQYDEGGSKAGDIMSKYKEREKANCSPQGHGLPGTMEGIQSLYSWLGYYRYNPGDSSAGGCYYLNTYIYDKNYCDTKPTCSCNSVETCNNATCSKESKTTVCEQNDYTAYGLKTKFQVRQDIFGL